MGIIISFHELKQQGITTTHLLQWMAPIDIAERYEKYDGNLLDVFFNCTPPWFGSACEYKFNFNTPGSFGDLVSAIFEERLKPCTAMKPEPCYPFLPSCDRGLLQVCLDWREICDGKFDCINGDDEQFCEQLELNECTSEEYRCHYGGQCIPKTFVGDGRTNADCLDASDETDARIVNNVILRRLNCHTIPTFLCEDMICRYPHSFSCGDGDCYLSNIRDPYNRLCHNRRRMEIVRNLLTTIDNNTNKPCHEGLISLLRISKNVSHSCSILMSTKDDIKKYKSLAEVCSSDRIVIPTQPIMFGFFQFIYLTNRSNEEFEINVLPDFVCFSSQRCPGLLLTITPIELNNTLTCARTSSIVNVSKAVIFDTLEELFKDAVQRCLTIGSELSCSHSNLFHCSLSSRCISLHRIVDGFKDCYFGEDESYPACQLNDSSRFVCLFDKNKCLSTVAVGNLSPDCPKKEDELSTRERAYAQQTPFSYLCNGHSEISSSYTEAKDEEHCELWPCNISYLRCDRKWDCYNGIDELNCPGSTCLQNEHKCMLLKQNNDFCLPIEHIFEKYETDCHPDIRDLTRRIYFDNRTVVNKIESFSWNETKCVTVDKICRFPLSVVDRTDDTCFRQRSLFVSMADIAIILPNGTLTCKNFESNNRQPSNPFSTTSQLGFFPPKPTSRSFQHLSLVRNNNLSTTDTPSIRTVMSANDILHGLYCNRGILVRFVINKNFDNATEVDKCLCPPSYFGSRCQWQSQRISLTLRLMTRSALSIDAVFQVVVMLIDEYEQITANYEQITFIPIVDCNRKFNMYLLYPDRPKRISSNYSVRIDMFHKVTLQHYGSWRLPIPFQFLPVNRIAAELLIPEIHNAEFCPLNCGAHGHCKQYENNKSAYFCHCNSGYSGILCNIIHNCYCSNDSLCISPTICVCPLNKFGKLCYLKHTVCQSNNNPCQNNGLCIPNDDHTTGQRLVCLCKEGYSGNVCELYDSRIDIQFDEAMIKSVSAVLIHFVAIFNYQGNDRKTVFKKISYDRNTITLHFSNPYHLVLTEFPNKMYYLTVVQEIFTKSEHVSATVKSDQLCLSITELMDNISLHYEYYRRIKYYPLICRQNHKLMCFYDENYICLCDLDRFSNCIDFNHTVAYDCRGKYDCQNNGRCFENNGTCPTAAMCVCQDCYYGPQCQFSTKGFMLSLDPILGYQIKPHVSIHRQPMIVKLSIALATCLFGFGLVSGLLSVMTFRMKQPRETGCGWYLLFSSCISICTLIVLTVKFWTLVLSQKTFITNRSFLTVSCIIADASLKTLLEINDWLNACVAIERMVTVGKGVTFNKAKSKWVAKRIILFIILTTILTHLHDPFYYRLIDDYDTEEKRTWCFVQYSRGFEVYNTTMNMFHFITPFSINLISSIFIITMTARIRQTTQTGLTFIEHLNRQFQQHKHIIIAPCVFVLLSVPRLIIPFISGCMKTPRDPMIFLIAYFVSFIPATLHFYLFVWPSKPYMTEFNTSLRQTVRRFRGAFLQH